MIQSDSWIKQQVLDHDMITPFVPVLTRTLNIHDGNGNLYRTRKVLSYGLSSYGYDLRLSPKQFFTFRHIPGTVVDVKAFNKANLAPASLNFSPEGDYFILPAHSYGLGVALERIKMPADTTGICMGKSTYARAGIICNTTPAEAGWEGHLTLEFSNSSSADCRLYAGEGIAQLLFFKGEPCKVSYEDRKGKYQGQDHGVTFAKV